MRKMTIIGAGGWGTALANILAKKGFAVTMWARRKEFCDQLTITRENVQYLPGVLIPSNVHFTNDYEEAVKNSELILIATPSKVMRETIKSIKPYINQNTVVVSASKGLEQSTLLRMSEVIAQELGSEHPIAILSGPNHAEEVGRDLPSATVVASQKKKTAEFVQDAFMSPKFRVYTNPDVIGVEVGGALKNIIALGAGISDGLKFGDNSKSALLTRGLTEIARIGTAMGADTLTFAGLAGVGDLIATCTSQHSRNWRCGNQIGQGKSLKEILDNSKMVVEGVRTTEVVHSLAKKYNIEMPISNQIYEVLFKEKDPKTAVIDLMLRGKTNETEEFVMNQRANW